MIVYTVECAVGVYAWEGQFNSSRLFYMADVLQFWFKCVQEREIPERPLIVIRCTVLRPERSQPDRPAVADARKFFHRIHAEKGSMDSV